MTTRQQDRMSRSITPNISNIPATRPPRTRAPKVRMYDPDRQKLILELTASRRWLTILEAARAGAGRRLSELVCLPYNHPNLRMALKVAANVTSEYRRVRESVLWLESQTDATKGLTRANL